MNEPAHAQGESVWLFLTRACAAALAAGVGLAWCAAGTATAEDGPDDPLVAALLDLLPLEYREKTEAAGKQVAELFGRDPDLALAGLRRLHQGQAPALAKAYPDTPPAHRFDSRRGGTLDSVVAETFPQMGSDSQRLELLSRILRDEFLSRELALSLVTVPYGSSQEEIGILASHYEKLPWEQAIREVRNDRLARLCLAAPEDLPRIVLMPAILMDIQLFSIAAVVSLGPGGYWLLPDPDLPPYFRENGMGSILPPFWESSKRFPEIPDRFEAIRRPVNQLALLPWKHLPGWVAPELEPVLLPLLDEVERAALPANARLALAGPAISHCGWHLPASACTRFARWLAEAWEDHVAVDFMRESSILEHFTYAEESPDRRSVIARLLAAWETRERKLDAAYDLLGSSEPRDRIFDRSSIAWLAALAMESGQREAKERLLDSIGEYPSDLFSNPLFPVLIRGGEFERARRLLARREPSPFGLGPSPSSASPAWFDAPTEENLKAFAQTFPATSETLFIATLQMSALPDLPSAKLLADRPTRMKNLAREFDAIAFQSAPSKETALFLLAKHPEAAALVSEHFVSFARFNQIAEHHGSFRAETWSELAGHTLTALLEAASYDEALALLEQIDRHTLSENESYQRTWSELASNLQEFYARHEKELPSVAGTRPLLVMVLARPDEYFPEGSYGIRGTLMRRLLGLDLSAGRGSDWWQWRTSLDPGLRRSLDHGMLDRPMAGHTDPPPLRDAGTEESARLALVEVFDAVPPAKPLSEKTAAVLDFLRSDQAHGADGTPLLPSFAFVVETYHYFTPAELLSLGPEIAEALGHPPTLCYALARMAHEEGNTELSRHWLNRAHEARAKEISSGSKESPEIPSAEQ